MDNKKVVVALSGGVDSSVTALILQKQGYKVFGIHFRNNEVDDNIAQEFCDKLGIPLEIVDESNEMDLVKKYFVDEYSNGRTPNPCVFCNQKVKFQPFLEYANKIGADHFATGHYARVVKKDGITYLLKAKDEAKDQTYFLNQLSQKQLEKVLFPLADYTKQEIRKIAEDNGLITAHKKDSFDICFIGNEKFKDYMKHNFPEKSGKIIDIHSNRQVGVHDGLNKFTIGQRKGLNVGGQKDILGKWFVVKKDAQSNVLYVSTDENDLFSKSLVTGKFNFISFVPKQDFNCVAKIRYRQQDQECEVKLLEDGKVRVVFKQPQRAIATGQYCVLYDNEVCLGGGVIDSVE